MQGSLSKVGISIPHHLDIPNALVAGYITSYHICSLSIELCAGMVMIQLVIANIFCMIQYHHYTRETEKEIIKHHTKDNKKYIFIHTSRLIAQS